jgi:hypothetical protein
MGIMTAAGRFIASRLGGDRPRSIPRSRRQSDNPWEYRDAPPGTFDEPNNGIQHRNFISYKGKNGPTWEQIEEYNRR